MEKIDLPTAMHFEFARSLIVVSTNSDKCSDKCWWVTLFKP